MDHRSQMLALNGPHGAIAPMQYGAGPPSGGGMSLSQIIAIVRAHWREGMMIAGATALSVGLVSLVLPKTYTATATVMVNYEINDPLGGREFPTGLIGTYMSTQVELLGRPEVLLAVVESLKLDQNKKYTKSYDGDPRALREWIAKNLARNLKINQGAYGSQLIHVTFSSSDPQEASAVANEVVTVYMAQGHKRQTDPATEHARRYTTEMEELRDRVGKTQEQLNQFRRRSNIVDVQAKADIEIAVLNELEQRLLEAQNKRRSAESKLVSDHSVSAGVLESQMVQGLKTQLATLESRLAQSRSTLGARHPEVMELQAQIGSTRSALQSEIQRYSQGTSGDVASARHLEQKLAAAVEQQRTVLLRVRQLQDEGAKYVLEFESAQAAYKKALEGYDAVKIASSGQYTNVSFASRATPPLRPTKPKLLVNLLLGIVLGGCLGAAIPFARELLSRRVRCRDDLERDHGIPVLVEFDPMPALRNAP